MSREAKAILAASGLAIATIAVGFIVALMAGSAIHHDTEIVVGTVVATPEGSPVARWYVETERGGIRRLAEIGPALYAFECFAPGDVYVDGSLGRCEGVVWP